MDAQNSFERPFRKVGAARLSKGKDGLNIILFEEKRYLSIPITAVEAILYERGLFKESGVIDNPTIAEVREYKSKGGN